MQRLAVMLDGESLNNPIGYLFFIHTRLLKIHLLSGNLFCKKKKQTFIASICTNWLSHPIFLLISEKVYRTLWQNAAKNLLPPDYFTDETYLLEIRNVTFYDSIFKFCAYKVDTKYVIYVSCTICSNTGCYV